MKKLEAAHTDGSCKLRVLGLGLCLVEGRCCRSEPQVRSRGRAGRRARERLSERNYLAPPRGPWATGRGRALAAYLLGMRSVSGVQRSSQIKIVPAPRPERASVTPPARPTRKSEVVDICSQSSDKRVPAKIRDTRVQLDFGTDTS